MSEKNEWKLVPVDRTYDMRVKAIRAFNTAEQAGKDRDDALDAAFQAMLAAAPCPTCNDQGAVGNILNAEPCPDCTPASLAPGDAQDADRMTVLYVAGAICRHLDMALDQSKVMAAARDIAQHIAAPAAGDAREVDPLQGAANWLVQAHSQPCPTVLSACLIIGYNRAQRLYDAAIAAQQGKGGEA